MDDSDDDVCPICCEELELMDRAFLPCPCGYQICMFCWNKIKEVGNGCCPACRRQYDEKPSFNPKYSDEDFQREQREKKRRLRLKKQQVPAVATGSALGAGGGVGSGAGGLMRAASVPVPATGGAGARGAGASAASSGAAPPPGRVVQRNLVFVVNLPPAVLREAVLRKPKYFGQYGTILKVVTKRGENSAYITFSTEGEARAAIHALNGYSLDGRVIKASFGTMPAAAPASAASAWAPGVRGGSGALPSSAAAAAAGGGAGSASVFRGAAAATPVPLARSRSEGGSGAGDDLDYNADLEAEYAQGGYAEDGGDEDDDAEASSSAAAAAATGAGAGAGAGAVVQPAAAAAAMAAAAAAAAASAASANPGAATTAPGGREAGGGSGGAGSGFVDPVHVTSILRAPSGLYALLRGPLSVSDVVRNSTAAILVPILTANLAADDDADTEHYASTPVPQASSSSSSSSSSYTLVDHDFDPRSLGLGSFVSRSLRTTVKRRAGAAPRLHRGSGPLGLVATPMPETKADEEDGAGLSPDAQDGEPPFLSTLHALSDPIELLDRIPPPPTMPVVGRRLARDLAKLLAPGDGDVAATTGSAGASGSLGVMAAASVGTPSSASSAAASSSSAGAKGKAPVPHPSSVAQQPPPPQQRPTAPRTRRSGRGVAGKP